MPAINSDTRSTWQELANSCDSQRPDVGKTVRVVSGRKNKDMVGIVTWHGRDKYFCTRYKTSAQLTLMDITGREGFRIRVESDAEAFFIDANKVEVVD